MKRCSKCKEEKEERDFHKCSRKGVQSRCRVCRALAAKEDRENSSKERERSKRYRESELGIETRKQWFEDNPSFDAWYSSNKRATQHQRTPKWFSEFDRFVMEEAYDLAKVREVFSGIKWHIDHIIPLRGKRVSGLHISNNIQVIPAKENLIKSNSFRI